MAHKKLTIPKDKLSELYWRKRLTSYKIADIYGCAPLTVINRMRELGIRRRISGPKRIGITRAILGRLYVKKGLSAYAIAKKFHCDQGAVLRALRRYEFSVRHPKRPVYIDRRNLYNLYVSRGLSTYEIAYRYQYDPKTVFRYLHAYKIPTRPLKRVKITENELRDLYVRQKCSLSEIGKIYGCHAVVILDRMRQYGIPRRTISETSTKHPKSDFLGNHAEKAYIIGFRLGDLGVRKNTNLIHISSGTTKDAQVELIKSLFQSYGPVWVGKKNPQGAVNVSCSLNSSFSFLLPKYRRVPRWILRSRRNFFSFLAGYTDAEGSISISNGMARFRLRSYDKGLLYDCHRKLRRLGIASLYGLASRAGVDIRGVRHNKSCWYLAVNDKRSLHRLFAILQKLLRHEKRRRDLEMCLNNVVIRLKLKPKPV